METLGTVRKYFSILIICIVLFVIGAVVIIVMSRKNQDSESNDMQMVTDSKDLIRVYSPLPNERISSPLIINGEARGNWYFEASFPIVLTDPDGNVIASSHADALSDWMTSEYVPFSANLDFDTGDLKSGILILKKDNPSGLTELDDEIKIPIQFLSKSPR